MSAEGEAEERVVDEEEERVIDEDNPRRSRGNAGDEDDAEREEAPRGDEGGNGEQTREGPHPRDLPGVTVLVRNVSFDARREDIEDAFSAFGNVIDVHMPKDYATRRPKGLAFVKYAVQSEADEAVEKGTNMSILGREVRCEIATAQRKSADEYARDRPPRRDFDDRRRYDDRPRHDDRGRGGYDDRSRYDDRGRGGHDDRRYDDRGRGGYDDRRPPRRDYDRRDDRPYAPRPRGVCYAWREGKCDRGDSCRFAHSEDASAGDFRRDDRRGDRPPQVCFDWQRGQCTRGDSCRFVHEGEQRA